MTEQPHIDIISIIKKVQNNLELSAAEIDFFVRGVFDETIPDYQISAFLMAVYFNRLNEHETMTLTEKMAFCGDRIDLSDIDGVMADKHSTGGVGDKTTLIVAPMIAACECGVKIAKMSGRGLGFTGGTIDKLESIAGLNTAVNRRRFIEIVNKTGLCVASQTAAVAPVDKRLYAIRDVTSTIDSIPLIASSIMSKKLAVMADCLVLDVKYGSGAFMKTVEQAEELAALMVKIGKGAGMKTVAFVTDMNIPLGNVGNSIEMIEVCNILSGNSKGKLYELCLTLAAETLSLSTGMLIDDARIMLESTIKNGAAKRKLADFVAELGGDAEYIYSPMKYARASTIFDYISRKSGYITKIDAEKIGEASLALGAGRKNLDDKIDHSAGIVFNLTIGDRVRIGECILKLHTNNADCLSDVIRLIDDALTIEEQPPQPANLIYKIIR